MWSWVIRRFKEKRMKRFITCKFLCHAWDAPFQVLMDIALAPLHVLETAIRNHNAVNEADVLQGQFYWIDIFCHNQHSSAAILSDVDEAMKSCHSVELVYWPARDPLVLHRTWCLYELWISMKLSKTLAVSTTMEDVEAADHLILHKNVQIDIMASQARKDDDRMKMIAFFEYYGVTAMEKKLKEQLAYSLGLQMENVEPYPACFDGDGEVVLADGKTRKVRDLQPGDWIRTREWISEGPRRFGRPGETILARVHLITKDDVPNGRMIEMCCYRGIYFTPEHPIFDDETSSWRCPRDILPVDQISCPTVFNLELDGAHCVEIGGVLAMTLGQEIGFDEETDQLYGWGWQLNPRRDAYLQMQNHRFQSEEQPGDAKFHGSHAALVKC